jgi:hypothetical protein
MPSRVGLAQVDDWPPEDVAEAALHYSEGGPVAAAQRWLAATEAGDFPAFWRLMDDNLRLVVAQDWIWANTEIGNPYFPDVPDERDDLAERIAADVVPADDELGDLFIAVMTDKFRGIGYNSETWGAASRPRLIAPDYELLLFVDTHGEVLTFDEPTLIETDLQLLMHASEGSWLVAGFTDRIPQPGWPPVDSGLGQPEP